MNQTWWTYQHERGESKAPSKSEASDIDDDRDHTGDGEAWLIGVEIMSTNNNIRIGVFSVP